MGATSTLGGEDSGVPRGWGHDRGDGMTHRLLVRQLNALGCSEACLPEDASTWRQLLDLVGRTYTEIEQDLDALHQAVEVARKDADSSDGKVPATAADGGAGSGRSGAGPSPSLSNGDALPAQPGLMSLVFEAADEGMVVIDRYRQVISANPAFSRVLGYGADEVVGKAPEFLLEGCGAERYGLIWAAVAEQGSWRGELTGRSADGEAVPLQLTLHEARDASGQTHGYVAFLCDRSEVAHSRRELEHVGTHDALTGLANRVLFYDRLTSAIHRCRRSALSGALLFIDLDRFKTVNDALGHQVGDELLIQVAHRIRSVSRQEDLVARMGGDEFALIVEDLRQPEQAAGIAEKLIELFSEPFAFNGYRFNLSASVGITIFPNEGIDNAELLKQADVAMYAAKQRGGNRFRFYLPELTRQAQQRASMEAGLRHAVDSGQLILLYQPQYALTSGELVSVEALVRWRPPELGLVLPQQFVHLAELTGLIDRLGEWVLREVCRQIVNWKRAGMRSVPVSVNIAHRQILDPGFSAMVAEILGETSVSADLLELEVAEKVLLDCGAMACQSLAELHAMGCGLVVDDFGSAKFSLADLMKYGFRSLKIDRGLIHGGRGRQLEKTFVQATVAMAKTLRLRVGAKGIQTAGQHKFALSQQCDEVQGFLYSPPVEAQIIPSLQLLRGLTLSGTDSIESIPPENLVQIAS